MSATRPISIKLEDNDREALARIALVKKRSAHFVAREAIKDYLAREAQRQAFIAQANASLQHYRETGLHITLEELSAWSDEYQDNPDASLPACHV